MFKNLIPYIGCFWQKQERHRLHKHLSVEWHYQHHLPICSPSTMIQHSCSSIEAHYLAQKVHMVRMCILTVTQDWGLGKMRERKRTKTFTNKEHKIPKTIKLYSELILAKIVVKCFCRLPRECFYSSWKNIEPNI